ncbi:MAG: hypothetical protein ACRELY_15125 [Polyangiaceae bacterium]
MSSNSSRAFSRVRFVAAFLVFAAFIGASTGASAAKPAPAVPNVAISNDSNVQPTPPASMSPNDKEPFPCSGDNCGDPWDLSSVLGVRISLLHNGGLQNKTTFGVTAQGAGESYRTYKLFSIRTSAIAGLGGGSGGLEGALGATFTGGIRVPVSEHHGPIIRVGLGGELLGNSQFYYSHIDLPIGEVGYQYISGHTILEAGVRGASLITGRYNTGDSFRRELGTSFELGGYIAAHGTHGRIDANFMHIAASGTDPGTGVDVLRGTACAYVTPTVGICGDAMFIHGDEQPPIPVASATSAVDTSSTSIYGGLLVGFAVQ